MSLFSVCNAAKLLVHITLSFSLKIVYMMNRSEK